MSHYSNVQELLDVIVDMRYDDLESLLDKYFNSGATDERAEFARSLVFILVSLWGGTSKEFRREFQENMTKKSVDEEIDLILWEEDSDD